MEVLLIIGFQYTMKTPHANDGLNPVYWHKLTSINNYMKVLLELMLRAPHHLIKPTTQVTLNPAPPHSLAIGSFLLPSVLPASQPHPRHGKQGSYELILVRLQASCSATHAEARRDKYCPGHPETLRRLSSPAVVRVPYKITEEVTVALVTSSDSACSLWSVQSTPTCSPVAREYKCSCTGASGRVHPLRSSFLPECIRSVEVLGP
ncbi:uncharacterized protein LOC132712437 [Pantherophis guttatus]|uniref:Uncharacterized protein LOC132711051 n=1 Tax=Pantherophis guttatus TaxID=94885 RepID=A0ABM3Z9J6_PANGU|nr:uncharacterized protein LOC132711051 [Pantherophis guttatus]XP_060549850.1 uncharacterized protein LOC132712437 [Pantherophis guttatus]